jgi:hypothetical protein
LSHTGQSSGWFTSRNSSTPSCALRVAGDPVETVMPSEHSIMHAGWRAAPRPVSMSTMHMRHIPTDRIRGW